MKWVDSQALELLSPARDAETAIAAIEHGADAVYIGAPAFGARSAATNSIEDIKKVVAAAAPFGVKIYVTLNTILFQEELEDVRKMVVELWNAGVDALIVQDPALLLMDLPPIELHASTQWNSDSVNKIVMLARAGFSQIVVPREFSLEKIRKAYEAVDHEASLEVFVHGALCVSYSGGCHAGQVLAGRSANRGRCPQICRLPFTLTGKSGKPVDKLPDGGRPDRHWLSLADMNRLDSLEKLADAGARSFKIEGRLKPIGYVKNVTAAYSRELDRIIAGSNSRYKRSSYGRVTCNFEPDIFRTFNRGYTRYFLTSGDRKGLISWSTPKWVGPKAAVVENVSDKRLAVNMTVPLHNGDGLSWFDNRGDFHGFRVNKVEGNNVFPAPGSDFPKCRGTILYRNGDTAFDAHMDRKDSAHRCIDVDFTLRHLSDGRMAIDASDVRGCRVTVTSRNKYGEEARKPQDEVRSGIMQRLGDTVYEARNIDDRLGNLFVPASELTALRRDVIDALDRDWNMRRRRNMRKPMALKKDEFFGQHFDYKANISNSLSRKFYLDHGAKDVDDALEVKSPDGEVQVMTTDYCIRRELGACLKTQACNKLPDELWLDAPAGRLRLEFDCENCRMKIFTDTSKNKLKNV